VPKGVRTRHQTRMEEDGELPPSLVGRIPALIEEGALSKAAKLLVSTGLADSQDPAVKKALVDLHSPSLPHLVMGGDLPVDVKSNVAIEEDKDEEEAT